MIPTPVPVVSRLGSGIDIFEGNLPVTWYLCMPAARATRLPRAQPDPDNGAMTL